MVNGTRIRTKTMYQNTFRFTLAFTDINNRKVLQMNIYSKPYDVREENCF